MVVTKDPEIRPDEQNVSVSLARILNDEFRGVIMKNDEKNLISYIRDKENMLLIIVWSVILIILSVCILCDTENNNGEVCVYWLYSIICLLALVQELKKYSRFRNFIKTLRENNMMKECADDFAGSVSYLDDKVRLGEKYIFAKGKCVPISYEIIEATYLKRGKKQGGGFIVGIFIKVKNTKAIKIAETTCYYIKGYFASNEPDRMEGLDEVRNILKAIQKKCPEIELKYVHASKGNSKQDNEDSILLHQLRLCKEE